ncbi:hypothetical protein GIB67_019607 [Kingdonia uniflora]|uniref:FAR1 domain-containing protein n=1 Tax=Kingdonia uniflora TaxID=39325 RepID=A0A7J7N0N2_9MAGN|nr:hypothetical protein GIB67_019607 [Kingdonia uniflora]
MESNLRDIDSNSQLHEFDLSFDDPSEYVSESCSEGEEAYVDELDRDRELQGDDEDQRQVNEHAKNCTRKPQVGMVFDSIDDACQFYSNYAREMGFGIRRGSSRKSKKDYMTVIWREFVCSKEGFRHERYKQKEATKKKKRGETRTGCEAKLVIKLQREKGSWMVSMFVEKHNHEYETQRKRQSSSSGKKVSESQSDEAMPPSVLSFDISLPSHDATEPVI